MRVHGCAWVRVCARVGAWVGARGCMRAWVCVRVCVRIHERPPSPKVFDLCFCFSGNGFGFVELSEKFQLVNRGINALCNFVNEVLDFAILRKPLSFLLDVLFQRYQFLQAVRVGAVI